MGVVCSLRRLGSLIDVDFSAVAIAKLEIACTISVWLSNDNLTFSNCFSSLSFLYYIF